MLKSKILLTALPKIYTSLASLNLCGLLTVFDPTVIKNKFIPVFRLANFETYLYFLGKHSPIFKLFQLILKTVLIVVLLLLLYDG